MRSVCFMIFVLAGPGAYAGAINVNLGTAGSYGVLAGSNVTNTGASIVNGNLGVSPGSSITGFPPGTVTGATHSGDAAALQAQNDLTTAYNFAAGETGATDLTGQDLGGMVLLPGVYKFTSAAQLTGVLTLDNLGDPNAVFVFQIASTLTTATNSSIAFSGIGADDSVYWQVGSSATLGTNSLFAGDILALSSITLNTGADIQCGSALARNGAVTLDRNDVGPVGCAATPVPEPDSMGLLGAGLLPLVAYALRWRRRVF